MMGEKKLFVFVAPAPGRTILWPCSIPVPVDGGWFEEQELTAKFSLDYLSDEEHQKIVKGAIDVFYDPNKALLEKVLIGFDGVKNAEKQDVPDADMFAIVWASPFMMHGLVHGYMVMREGRLPKN